MTQIGTAARTAKAGVALLTPRLVDEATAAAYLGRSRSAFHAQLRKGQVPGPSDRNGAVPLWDVQVLDRFIDAKSGLGAPSNSWGD